MAYDMNQVFTMQFTLKKLYKKMPDGAYKVMLSPKKSDYQGQKLPKSLIAFGKFINPYEGDDYECKTIFRLSDRLGYYLKFVEIPRIIIPGSDKEMIKFISKNVKGLGKKSAEEIVSVLGADVVSKVASEPKYLDSLKLSLSRKEAFAEWCKTSITLNDLIVKMMILNLPAELAVRIYETFGNSSILKINENPYQLSVFAGLTFTQTDTIAKSIPGICWNDARRLNAAIYSFVLGRSLGGNICIPSSELTKNINRYIERRGVFESSILNKEGKSAETGFSDEEITSSIKNLVSKNQLETIQGPDDSYVYLRKNAEYEKSCVANIVKRIQENLSKSKENRHIPEILEKVSVQFKLDEMQQKAVEMALLNNLSVLTGRPGTGKTYVLQAILLALTIFNPEINIVLAAPTGRAASRMTETTGHDAATLHNVLRIFPGGTAMPGQEGFKLTADYLIIDETSMIDSQMMSLLFSRISESTKLLFIGDPMQLPSVGPGNVLAELLKIREIPRVQLVKVFRQALTDSCILYNANQILNKSTQFQIGRDFIYIPQKTEQDIADFIERDSVLHREAILSGDYIYLSPIHKMIAGVDEINRIVQDSVNSANKNNSAVISETCELRLNDRVINTKNNSELEVHNGDLGRVVDIQMTDQISEVEVLFDDKEDTVIFTGSDIQNLTLAYCLTVHKAQGSEAKEIAMIFSESHLLMLSSRLIYTGLTRARDRFYCIGSLEAMQQGVLNQKTENRYSLLSYLTENKLKKSDKFSDFFIILYFTSYPKTNVKGEELYFMYTFKSWATTGIFSPAVHSEVDAKIIHSFPSCMREEIKASILDRARIVQPGLESGFTVRIPSELSRYLDKMYCFGVENGKYYYLGQDTFSPRHGVYFYTERDGIFASTNEASIIQKAKLAGETLIRYVYNNGKRIDSEVLCYAR